MTRWILLWVLTTALAAGIGYATGRMTSPEVKVAYMIPCDLEQMERVKQLARDYRAQGRSVISALTQARLEVCL